MEDVAHLSETIATLKSERTAERKKTDEELQKLTATCQKLEGEFGEEREKSGKKIGSSPLHRFPSAPFPV
jgi:hypothetical protein